MKCLFTKITVIFLLNIRTLPLQNIEGSIEDCFGFQNNLNGIFDHISIAEQYDTIYNKPLVWSINPFIKDSIHRLATCKHFISDDHKITGTIFFILKEDYVMNEANATKSTKLEFVIDDYNLISYFISTFNSKTLLMEGCLGIISLKEYNLDLLLNNSIKYIIQNFTDDAIICQIQNLDKLFDKIEKESVNFMSRYCLIIFESNLIRFRIFYYKLIILLSDKTNLANRIKDLLRSEIENESNYCWDIHFQDRNIDNPESKIKHLSLGLITDLFNIIELSKNSDYKFMIHSLLLLNERLVCYHMACLSLDFSCVDDIENFSINFIDNNGNSVTPFLSKLSNKLYKCGFLKSELIKKSVNTIKCVGIHNGIKYESINFKINY